MRTRRRRTPTVEDLERRIVRLLVRAERRPDDGQLWQEVGKAHFECHFRRRPGALARAEAALRRSAQLNPLDPWTHTYIASMFHTRGRYKPALVALERARSLAPALGIVWVVLGQVHAALREYARADECFRQAVSLEPGYEYARREFKRWLAFWEPERERRERRRGTCGACGYWMGSGVVTCPACGASRVCVYSGSVRPETRVD
jgi:tetratricopeptide (TPR) repeat protein